MNFFNLTSSLIKRRSFLLSSSSYHVRRNLSSSSLSPSSYYITTPIYYVNGPPHIGHAYTSILCDILARSERLRKVKDVFFLTGTDEHGLKILQKANSMGIKPIELADQNSAEFKKLLGILDISNNDFIRTTEERHKKFVDLFWRKLEKQGDIYKGSYSGWYSVQDEAYYNDDEVEEREIEVVETYLDENQQEQKRKVKKVSRVSISSGSSVSWMEEESYFFRLSKYEDAILKYFEDHPDFIQPPERRKDIISFIHEQRELRNEADKAAGASGLKDLCISRSNFSWGIPVPGDAGHVIYVWLDALTNYLSALPQGSSSDLNNPDQIVYEYFKKFWPANVHVVGKDILRFHALYWPAFLLSAGLPLPKHILAHGWWTIDGVKMSKSLGNILDPVKLSEQYGSDYLRFYLSSEILLGKDGSFNFSRFQEKVNSFLVNDIGNLYRRLFVFLERESRDRGLPKITEKSLHTQNIFEDDKLISIIKDDNKNSQILHQIYLNKNDLKLLSFTHQTSKKIFNHIEEFQIKNVVEEIVKISTACNKYMEEEAPWNLIKFHKKWIKDMKKSQPDFDEKNINDSSSSPSFSPNFHRFEQVMITLLEVCRIINLHLESVTPHTSKKFSTQSFNIPSEYLYYLPSTALPSSSSETFDEHPCLPEFIFSLKIKDSTALFPKLELLPEHKEKEE